MADLEPVFREMVEILSQAQLTVQAEIDGIDRSLPRDVESLWRLSTSLGEFSSQADNLLVMMVERDAPDDLIDTAETLVDFFQDARMQIAGLLKAGRA